MGFDFLDFLGGVAEGASKTLDQQMEAQKEAIAQSSSAAIRSRLAKRQKHLEKVNAVKEEVLPLLNSYNIEDVAYLMKLPTAERKELLKKFQPIQGKDARSKLFKGLKQFQEKIPNITPSKLINSLIPAYKESELDVSGLIPKTFADVLFDTDPSEKLTKAIKRGTPDDTTIDTTDRIAGLGGVTDFYGLSKQGKILAYTQPAKDTYRASQKTFLPLIHSYLGGTGTFNENLQRYVPTDAKDKYFQLAEQVNRIITPEYNRIVRDLQLQNPTDGLIGAQEKAKLMLSSSLNKQFFLEGDTAKSISAMEKFITSNSPGTFSVQTGTDKEKISQQESFKNNVNDFIQNNVGNSSKEQSTSKQFFGTLFPKIVDELQNNNDFATVRKIRSAIRKYVKLINKNATYEDQTKFETLVLNRLKQLGIIN